jgi:hypothetical protein
MKSGTFYGENAARPMALDRIDISFKEGITHVCHESDASDAGIDDLAGADRLGRRQGWEP